MGVAVTADGVAAGGDCPKKLRMGLCRLPQDEEGGVGTILSKGLEDRRRELGARAVVKGERKELVREVPHACADPLALVASGYRPVG